ncbi:zinc finger protein 782 [Astyanax mexicanus]|uniref:Zinc finger protein 865 n=1 Tax=Astyanax mexicanus TaxID=7994 RepID=A0A8B9K752_ASTMX|nr:zinc finger protein 782 [Astyanax mexicanus]XP_022539329.2 zinc finger protein 782 [Astyanax mexicanus]
MKGDTKQRQNRKHIPTETGSNTKNEGVPAKRAKKLKVPTSKTRHSTTPAGASSPNHSSSDLEDAAGQKKTENSDMEYDVSIGSSISESWDVPVSNNEVEFSSLKQNTKMLIQSRKSKDCSKDNTEKLPVKRRNKNTLKQRTYVSLDSDHLECPISGFSARPLIKKKEKSKEKRRKKDPTQCKHCSRLIKGRVAMERHMLTHTGEKPFECYDCGRRYSNSSNLRIHQQSHTGKMDYSCEQCGQKFTHLSYLKVHLLRHSDKRPHTCDQCGKGFIQKYHLKRHLLVHSDKIPYTCDKCDATFNRMDCLRLHMRSVHLINCNEIKPNKPFKCDMCEKAFTTRTSLEMHSRIHTGITPFSCSICQRKFKQSSQMHSHMRTHSGEKPYACDICGMKFLRKNYVRIHKEKKHLSKVLISTVK